MLTGLYKPTSGSVVFDNAEITGDPVHEIASGGMARTFQNIRLFGLMTAQENVMVAMHSKMNAGVFATIFRTKKQKLKKQKLVASLKNFLITSESARLPMSMLVTSLTVTSDDLR